MELAGKPCAVADHGVTRGETTAALASLSATASPSGPSNADTTFNIGANADWAFRGDFESCTP